MKTSATMLLIVWAGCVEWESPSALDDRTQTTIIENGRGMGANGRELASTRLEYARTVGTIDGRVLNVSLARGELRGTCADGTCALAGASFANVILEAAGRDGNPKQVRVASAVAQTVDIYHYGIQVRDTLPSPGAWEDACPGGYAIAVAGRWDYREGEPGGGDYDARKRDGVGLPVVTFACQSSAIQKCVERLEYAPWLSSFQSDREIWGCVGTTGRGKPECRWFRPSIGADRALEACTRMVRGDYCGNGLSMTLDGTTIDVYDNLLETNMGIAQPWNMEAAWDPYGARCVSDLRLQTVINVPQDGVQPIDSVANHLQRLCPVVLDPWWCSFGAEEFFHFWVPMVSQTPWRVVNNPAPTANQYFGAVMISDGTRLVVGVPAANAVYNYGSPSAFRTIPNPNRGPDRDGDRFGASMALFGNRIAVGAPGADGGFGRIYIFANPEGTLLRIIDNPSAEREIVPPYDNDRFGESMAVIDGRLIVSAPLADCPGGDPDAGTVYALDLDAAAPVAHVAHGPRCPIGFSNFGTTLSPGIGGVFFVGASLEGELGAGGGSVYAVSSATLAPVLRIANPEPALNDGFGSAIAIGGAGKIYIGAPLDSVTDTAGVVRERAGRVFIYNIVGTPLGQVTDPAPLPDDHFGISLSTSPDGTRLAIGSQAIYKLGAVRLVDATSDQITSTINNPAGTPSFFGNTVIVLSSELLIAAPLESAVGNGTLWDHAGMVYRYVGPPLTGG